MLTLYYFEKKVNIILEPREKVEPYFVDYLPKKKLKKESLVEAEKLKAITNNKKNVRGCGPIEESSIPLSGSNQPIYCGNCGKNTKGEI